MSGGRGAWAEPGGWGEWLPALVSEAGKLGVGLDANQARLLLEYGRLLGTEARMAGLTAVVDPEGVVHKHLVDSVAGWRALAREVRARHESGGGGGSLVDVGSGGGLPGIPLAILLRGLGWRVALVEATGKKADFLRRCVARLSLSHVEVISRRAEEVGRNDAWRQSFDAAVARAVGPMPVVLEYCLPLVRLGGCAVLYRGPRGREEAKEWQNAAERLGGRLEGVDEFVLPSGGEGRSLVVFRKTQETPQEFPRRAGVPQRRPLGCARAWRCSAATV